MSKEQGFTLIELVIVVIILAILTVTAIPKFIDLSRNAQIAKLESMRGALRSGAKIIYVKALIQNKTAGSDSVTVGGSSISLHGGYPSGHWQHGFRYLVNLDTVTFSTPSAICDVEWCARGNQTSIPSGRNTSLGRMGKLYPKGYSWNDQCGVYYINHENGNEPEIGLVTRDC